MKSKLVDQVEELLKKATTAEDIAETERIIVEAKRKVVLEPYMGLGEGKRSCWEMFHCPDIIRNECPAPKSTFLPCCVIEGTYANLTIKGQEAMTPASANVPRLLKVG